MDAEYKMLVRLLGVYGMLWEYSWAVGLHYVVN